MNFVTTWIIAGAATLLAIASPYLGIADWTPGLATVSAFVAVSLMGLNLVFGYCGMLVLGQAAFAAIAAYACFMIFNAGAPIIVGALVGLGLAVVAARLLATVFLRLPGIYLAIGTLGLAYVIEGVTRALPGVTGGASGLVLRAQLQLGDNGWYAIAVALLLIAVVSMRLLLKGSTARSLQLLRRDELATEVAGIDVTRLKVKMFTIGATYTAVGGIALSQYVTVVSPEMGGASMSLEYLAMVIIGGAGSLLGPIVGSVIVHWLFAASGAAQKYELLVFGASFFLVVLFAPRGVVGLVEGLIARIATWRAVSLSTAEAPLAVTGSQTSAAGAGRRLDLPSKIEASLVIEAVTKNFGGVTAVKSVSLNVYPGEIVALLGPNGAGKSTLLNVLSGIETMDSGAISLSGRAISALPIHERSKMMGRSFQVPRLIGDMSVLQNVLVRVDQIFPEKSETERLEIGTAQLKSLGLDQYAHARAQEITIGLHKLIDIARASVGNLPVMLLDEPGVGLSGQELERLRAIITKLRDGGAAVVVVDHNIQFILSLADRILVMEGGAQIALGSADQVMADKHVQRAYLGAFS